MLENSLDLMEVRDKGDDAHLGTAFSTAQGIYFEDTADEPRPGRGSQLPSEAGSFHIGLALLYLREGKRKSQNNTREEEPIGRWSLFIYHLNYL